MSKINESKINIKNSNIFTNDINEINVFKRTIDNYTHEDISDKKIKQITSYRKSQKKFLSIIIFNILTFGLLHFISKCYPKIYLKLYCKKCSPKNSDFFLIEDLYGNFSLCQAHKVKKIKFKNKIKHLSYEESSKVYMCLYSSWNLKNLNITNNTTHLTNEQFLNIKNKQIISFYYNSRLYEYDEINNKVIPVYLNLQGKTNKNIINTFQGGLSSEYLSKKIEERYGKNEYKLNVNVIYIYFRKVELKLLIYSLICGSMEVAIQDGMSTGILTTIIIGFFICRKIYMWKMLKNYDEKDLTLDGEKNNKPKVKRKYLFNKDNNNNKKRKKKKREAKKLIEESLIKNNNKIENLNGKNNANEKNKNSNVREKKEDDYKYAEINNSELLPGDIIYLKRGDFVPCDGIILDGDCVVNELELNENLEYTYKTYLKYTNDIFIYKNNKNSILLHGTKIIKIYKKNNIFGDNKQNKFITVLCINTGPNTYKANQITNVLDLLEKKEQYKKEYKIFSGQRAIFLICISTICFLVILIPTIIIIIEIKKYGFVKWFMNKMSSTDNSNSSSRGPPRTQIPTNITKNGPSPNSQINSGGPPNSNGPPMNQGMDPSQFITEEDKKSMLKSFLINYFIYFILRAIIKSYMPVYFVISSIIILLGVYHLYKINIFCLEKMRILYSGEINTIFMSKVNVLSNSHYEIKGFFPAFQASKGSNVILQQYHPDQIKDFSSVICNYYSNIKNNKESFIGLTNISLLNKVSGKLSVWFLECLFCCNNLIKIRHDIQGNLIEKNLINAMKWEIKVIDEENSSNEVEDYIIEKEDNINGLENSSMSESDDDSNKILYYGMDKEEKYIYNKIMDVFPENYYKMMDKKNFGYQKLVSRFKFFLSKSILKRSVTVKENENKFNFIRNSEKNSVDSSKKNPILRDLSNTKCSSYKLRIYKKFLTKNSFYSSAIVYNFYLKTLRFMTKGSPEKILPKCVIGSLPENICQIISDFRKEGFIIIVCASKKIDLYLYNDSLEENDYMSDLVFCGFITLKNDIKKDSKKAINELKKMNCEIIMNTGDELYNSIGTGFEIDILENKKIFAFDLDENRKKIYVNNIYRPSLYKYEIDDKFREIKRKRISSKYLKKNNKRRELSQEKVKKTENDNHNKVRQSNVEEEIKNYQNLNELKLFTQKKHRVQRNNNINKNNNSLFSSERIHILNRSTTIIGDKKLKFDNKKLSNLGNLQKKSFIKSQNDNFISNNIAKQKENKNQLISENPNKLNKTKNNNFMNNNNNIINNKDKKKQNENSIIDAYNQLYSFPNEIENDEVEKEHYIKEYFSNICYYNESFLDNLLPDSIFCISGKALKFIHDNKESKKYEKLFKILFDHSKIFYSMTSQDKSFLIDLYRDLPNKKTCMIGYSNSDIDSMLTAHVGISLKKPNNINTILSHFYLQSQDLTYVKTIIEHGRVILENIFLMSFLHINY